MFFFFFSSRRRHTRSLCDWSSDVCSSDLVGAGDGNCVLLAVGARDRSSGRDWGGYTVDENATRHGAGVEEETTDPDQAYARVVHRKPTRYREGWLPD